MIDYLGLIDKYYAQAPELRHILVTHSRQVADRALRIVDAHPQWTEQGLVDRQFIEEAAMLHDIGMIGVSDDIIYKVEKLDDKDWAEIKNHVRHGVRILEDIKQLKDVVELIKYHHEFYNGNGYPAGLAGDAIPLGSRIIAIADAYDAMISTRAYRQPRSEEQAIEILHNMRGIQFDPDLVEVFDSIIDEARAELKKYEAEHQNSTENQ